MKRAALAALAIMMALAWLAGVAVAAPVQASDTVSYSIWTVDGASVRVRVLAPTAAARKLAASDGPTPSLATVASAVSRGLSIATPGGDCEAVDQGEGVGQIYTLALTPGLDRFEIVFTCPQASGLTLKDDVLFDQDPRHIDYAQVRIGAGQPVLNAFTRDQRTLALPASAGQLRGADPVVFARMAAFRLANSLAALAVLVGSVLLARRWLDLAWLGAGLAVGYLTSLGVALSGLVVLDQGLANALLGPLVAALGLGVLGAESGVSGSARWRQAARVGVGLVLISLIVIAALKTPSAGLATFGIAIFGLAAVQASRRQPSLRVLAYAPAAAFAFFDGLGPASDLTLLQPRVSQLVPILAGHDLGGWLASMAIAGVALGLLWLAGLRLRSWRQLGSEVAGAALIGCGFFWFVTRLYS